MHALCLTGRVLVCAACVPLAASMYSSVGKIVVPCMHAQLMYKKRKEMHARPPCRPPSRPGFKKWKNIKREYLIADRDIHE